MKVLEIDSVPYGSTCKISIGIAKVAKEHDIEVYTASGYSSHPIKELPENHIDVGGKINKGIHYVVSRLTGIEGFLSICATNNLIKFIKEKRIDIIHLHNLHGCYLNFPMLFNYIKQNDIPVVWTLHDCWNFTGLCPHFTMTKCEKWKTGCSNCPQYRQIFGGYWFDRSKEMWNKKREWFTGVRNMTIITPSRWLSNLVSESFLGNYPVRVINNGIDLSVFNPRNSRFREQYHCKNKFILLGVSVSWGIRKGLDVFVELSHRLGEQYKIVLVGTNDEIDKALPDNIISIHRTQNQRELAEIYSAADLFINPTREENFPTVNLEALACGTPIVTFDTGGSPECFDETCGCAVDCDDTEGLIKKIEHIQKNNFYSSERCAEYAQRFDMTDRFLEYISLYKEIW